MRPKFLIFAALLCAAMPTLAATVSGHVVDENGNGAAGAWVTALEAGKVAPVRADENGAFELRDVPLDKFTILAARGVSYARLPADALAATPTELQLQTPAAPDRDALAMRALEGKIQWWRLEDSWDVLGTERIVKLIDQQLAADDVGDFDAQIIFQTLAKRAPQALLARAPALLEKLPETWRSQRQAQIYGLSVKFGDANSRESANAWLDEQKAIKRDIDTQSVTQLLQMASVASELQRPDAQSWLDYADAVARQTTGFDASDSRSWGALIAPLGYENAADFAEVLKPANEFYFWSSVYPVLAESGDAQGAEKAVARMDALAKTPEMKAREYLRVFDTPKDVVAGARLLMAKLVAKNDPARARNGADGRHHLGSDQLLHFHRRPRHQGG